MNWIDKLQLAMALYIAVGVPLVMLVRRPS